MHVLKNVPLMFLRVFLELPYPVIKTSGKLQLNSGRIVKEIKRGEEEFRIGSSRSSSKYQ
jgi:hypothetical protein